MEVCPYIGISGIWSCGFNSASVWRSFLENTTP
jgi:hypothetical protein